ncbi:hypothetical protein HGRIS_012651 [Hohenbuehelia grisea]|uniref:RING-type E3 ubiquitin transferase n=1 Tax=Hohenbuehelia grisea TaxID=104357 RepID=A0ABR3IT23_9AGAR
MSTQTATKTQASRGARGGANNAKRGGNKGRGGGRGGTRGGKAGPVAASGDASSPGDIDVSSPSAVVVTAEATTAGADDATASQAGDGPDVCWICAEPVKYYSVPPCNHRTCHVCALRLRALYKKRDCTFCKESQPSLIFSVSPEKLFASYTPNDIPFKDAPLEISFETEEMMEETLILLRFNCPDSNCSYIGMSWNDLNLHVRGTHQRMMCNMCMRMKKVFAHEHYLYTRNELGIHLPSLSSRSSGKQPQKQVEGGVHPLCQFCNDCFFGDDELYAHMREKHEECFVCKRNEVRDQYFQNYEHLEQHFHRVHFPCDNTECLAQKFVVFNTKLDLQGHMVEVHGAQMNSRDKKEARRIEAGFEFEEVSGQGRRGGRRDREHERTRDPPQAPPPPAPGPVRPPGPGRRREGFGGNLTTEQTNGRNARGPSPARNQEDSSDGSSNEEGSSTQPAYISRIKVLATNPSSAVRAVKSAIRSYRAYESGARDLISTIWNVMDCDLEQTASVVNSFVDSLDEDERKQDVLSKWKGFEIEQKRQFPELVPSSVGSGYAGIASGRVLNVKHSSAVRSSQGSSRQVWDRVAQAASSSSRPQQAPAAGRRVDHFPPIQRAAASPATVAVAAPAPGPAFRQPQRSTPWASSGAGSGSRTPVSAPTPPPLVSRPSSQNFGAGKPRGPPPKLSESAFPTLPAVAPRPKAPVSGNQSLKNILGNAAPTTSAWQSGGTNSDHASTAVENGDTAATSGGKGKKNKGKQKQTLFKLGAFPS